jgi:two-component system chemotaxis sensor kinase CheA
VDDFERELKVSFLEEAEQLLQSTEQSFLLLEKDPQNKEELEKLFRLAHNLKGSAKAVGFDHLGLFTHELESYLIKLKNGEVPMSVLVVSLLLTCNDHVSQMVQGLKDNYEAVFDSASLIEQLQNAKMAAVPETPSTELVADAIPDVPGASEFDEPANAEQVEAKIPEVAESAIEASPVEQTAAALPNTPAATLPTSSTTKKEESAKKDTDESIRVSLSKIEKLINYVGEMVILQSVAKGFIEDSTNQFARKNIHQLSKVTKEVQELSMSLRMVPIKPTFQKMQRIVRDTSAMLNKKVDLHLEGEDTEIDKTLLELLSDPLVHLIRNAVDHGIESTGQARIEAGKAETGNVYLSARQSGSELLIEIRDDGKGLDKKRILQKARDLKLVKESDALTDSEIYYLIFKNGFSTKAEVSEVSGRGVGMDVVKTNIESLEGRVELETNPGFGSTFKIFLPLTLAIIDGLIVSSQEEQYIIPLSKVRESVRIDLKQIQKVANEGEVLLLRDENIPLFHLSKLLKKTNKKEFSFVDSVAVVVSSKGKSSAIVVDELVRQTEVVIKQLGPEMKNLVGVSGSSILPNGRPALIIEPDDLIGKRGAA